MVVPLEKFNEKLDESGKFYSPLIERNSRGSIVLPGMTPNTIPVPTREDLKGFNSKDPAHVEMMSAMLARFGMASPDVIVANQQRFLANFDILPTLEDGSPNPRYSVALEQLQNEQSGRYLLAQARRTQQEYAALKMVNGNLEQEMIRIAEGEDPCDTCSPLDGITGTYAQMARDGVLPGGSSCLGGDNCLCQVYPID